MQLQPSSVSPQTLCTIAIGFHNRGDLGEAERLYLQLLSSEPAPAPLILNTARHMLGIIRYQQGKHAEALDLMGEALKSEPGTAEVEAVYAHMLQTVGRSHDALAHFDRALTINPDLAQHWCRRGAILSQLKRPAEALASFDRALAIDPDLADAWRNRGHVLHALERTAEALESLRRAWALRPNDPATLKDLGEVLCANDQIDEGLAIFRRHAELVYAAPAARTDEPLHKIQHDSEQQAFSGSDPSRLRLVGGEKLAGPAVNAAGATQHALQNWRTSRPQILVVDDVLTPEALDELRQFCWGSTIWRKAYADGYLGALPEHGFACPLLEQIARELRATYPEIFGSHPLTYFWAFKYGAQHSGIKLHADMAAVNVNFWLTPDEANRDPQHGGLVIWDAAAPPDWDFDKYNGDVDSNRAFVQRAGATATTIPYRSNRAVIFDSDLFHETDSIDFRDGYLNRRINVTLLFGRRKISV